MIALCTLIACAILNRMRGTKEWKGVLPGRPLFYVAPMVGAVVLLSSPLPVAAAFAAAYLFWGVWPWGRWLDLNVMPEDWNRPGVSMTQYEKIVSWLSCGNDHIAMIIRMLMAVPGFVLVGYASGSDLALWALLGVVFAVLAGNAYALGLWLFPRSHIPFAEMVVGLLWGVAILIA